MGGKLKSFAHFWATLLTLGDAFLATGLFLALACLRGIYKPEYLSICPFLFCLAILSFHAAGLYRTWRTATISDEMQQVLLGCFILYAGLFAAGFFLKISAIFSRFVLLTWVLALPLLLAAQRYGIRSVLRHLRKNGRNFRRVVIAGAGDLATRLIRSIEVNSWFGIEIICLFDDKVVGSAAGYPVIGGLESLPGYVKSHAIDIVYIALPMRAEAKIEMLMRELSDSTASVNLVPDVFVYELLLGGSIGLVEDMPVISLRESPFAGMNAVLKRLEDLVLASLILLVVSPLMLAVALAVKLTSKGPVFFKQRRYGLNGQVIPVYKFRSMTVCEDGFHISQATCCDPRVTRLGRFLRRTSIDELPQFVNVLQGRMSIVGPRPHAVAHNEQYRKLISGYMLRHKVKPGITGLAQVNGWRGETDSIDKMEMRVRYDLEYLRRWSILLDLEIIVKTILGNGWRTNAY